MKNEYLLPSVAKYLPYWRKFWSQLSEGWKRIHITLYRGTILVPCIILLYCIFNAINAHASERVDLFYISISSFFIAYCAVCAYLAITNLIYWIYEGFREKKHPIEDPSEIQSNPTQSVDVDDSGSDVKTRIYLSNNDDKSPDDVVLVVWIVLALAVVSTIIIINSASR